MSRYLKEIEGADVVYGFDHATGYFFQVFDAKPGPDGEDVLLVDECSLFTSMSKGRMMELMQEYDVDGKHIAQVGLDLPF